ncbi:MAG TPA: xanthine dehydrogenase family protein molybdopterin-binding subunit [candidate division Zixibacteria bacterium]|nr:xanthine dehydrogenase family protein molybdopterin-binding subunit [candidate division Zixibacteria bacterium]
MAKAEYSVLGRNIPRFGGVERVTGAGIYGIDLELRNALHGGILRSRYAHAKILSIDTRAAKAVPGVHAVVTGADAPDVRYGRTYIDRYMLARHKVRYMGDPVAAVAAESPAAVREALKKIEVVYEPLPVVLDPEEAMRPEAPTLHEDMPLPKNLPPDAGVKNVCSFSRVLVGDPDKAMAEADVVVEEAYETQMIHPQYLEPRIAAAQVEPDGRITVWANAQAPFSVRSDVARLLAVPLNRVRILSTELGGGFGGKASGITSGAAIEPICALLAVKSKRPVMIVLDKAEETVSTTIRSAARMYLKTGVKKDGTIVARIGKVIFDAGAYSGFGAMAGARCTSMLGGWYLMPNCRIDGYVVYTNKQVCGPVRGPGGPQAAFAVESHMDSIAARLGMDPVEFRLKNCPEPGDGIVGVPKLRDVSLGETIRLAAERIGWGKVKLEKNQGIGIATGSWIESAGPGGGAVVKVNEDGSVTVHIGKIDMGTAPRFGIPLIVAEELGVPVEDVTVVNVDTDASPWDAGTVGSRAILVSGTAARLAAIDARNQLLRLAATQLEANPEDLEIKDKQIRVKGTPTKSVSLAAVVTAAHNVIGEVIGRGYFDNKAMEAAEKERGSSQPFTTHACIVEVDPETGKVKILRYVAVHDIGFPIHPAAVEGQIEGAAAMGIGQALCEQVVFDENGRTLNPSFVDYLMPTINMMPRIETVLVPGYPGAGPYGAKGAGEIGCVPPMAAIANAIYNATGVRIRKVPLSPENVLRALRQARP